MASKRPSRVKIGRDEKTGLAKEGASHPLAEHAASTSDKVFGSYGKIIKGMGYLFQQGDQGSVNTKIKKMTK